MLRAAMAAPLMAALRYPLDEALASSADGASLTGRHFLETHAPTQVGGNLYIL
jgi:hypothetical protein